VQRRSLITVVDDVQPGPFVECGPPQGVLLGQRHRLGAERAPVGPPQRDGLQQPRLLRCGFLRATVPDDREQLGASPVRKDRDGRPDPVAVQGEPEVEQGSTAGQPLFPAVGVGDRQGARRIGVQLDRARAEVELPRLTVVQRRRPACGAQ
jgi:hypothetical protein